MKTLVIPFLENVSYETDLDEVRNDLAVLPKTPVDHAAWAEFPYQPTVSVQVVHSVDSIIVHFQVSERDVKSIHTKTNDLVYKDTCVEFFISFNGIDYYNIEFNHLGVGYTAYGNKEIRKTLPDVLVDSIKTSVSVVDKPMDGDTSWAIILNIPFSLFVGETVTSMKDRICFGNFYKCGDDLPVPHYLSWSPIKHPSPSFHQPGFFGKFVFAANQAKGGT